MIKKITCDVLGLPNYFSILLIIKATGNFFHFNLLNLGKS
jgi:hypothetical protein